MQLTWNPGPVSVDAGVIVFLSVVALSWSVSGLCLANLWRRKDSIFKKLRCSFTLILPVLGPVFYGGMYPPPGVVNSKQSGVEEYVWRSDGW